MTTTTTQRDCTRWMIRRDMAEVLTADASYGEETWTEEQYVALLRQTNCTGMVFEDGEGRVCGHMLYTLHDTCLRLERLAVAPQYQRQGVGSALLAKLCSKLPLHRRTAVTVEVSGRNLPACCFLRANGLRCVSMTQRDGEDVYLFRFLRLDDLSGTERTAGLADVDW